MVRFSWKSWRKTVFLQTAGGGTCHNLVVSGEDSDWEDLARMSDWEKETSYLYSLISCWKICYKAWFPRKISGTRPNKHVSTLQDFSVPLHASVCTTNPQEYVIFIQVMGPQNLLYGNFISIPQHTRLLEIRQKIREAFCLKMSFLKVKSLRQSQFTQTRERLSNSLVPGKKSFAWKSPLVCHVDKQAFSTPNWNHWERLE